MDEVDRLIAKTTALVRRWEEKWGAFERDASLEVADDRVRSILADYARRLEENYPFFHPRYAGQMLKPPHPLAVAAYAGAMLVNPNNHALDGGPATARMEKEVVGAIAAMFGLPDGTLGHLTTSGTIANLEALWIARELHPDRGIVVSELAHYTHERMAALLKLESAVLPADRTGRLSLDALERALQKGSVGTIVLTAGTTGSGAVDPVRDAVELAKRYGARVHVDAAYGGFYRILATEAPDLLSPRVAADLIAISEADSVVVDPHKHGLQPYGCGCVLFRDPGAGKIYRHDSPYTYFTSDELHLGEISIECSRAGAAAGALWVTLQAFPLTQEGLGAVLAGCRRGARTWHDLLIESDVLVPVLRPQLDIVTFHPRHASDAGAVDSESQRLFERAMQDPVDPIFLSVLRIAPRMLPAIGACEDYPRGIRVLRSVLMKPEHRTWVPRIHARLESFARENE